MSKWFLLLLLITGLVGFYWTIGSGTFADRTIHMHLQRAAGGGTSELIQSHMDSIGQQIKSQRVWIDRLKFIARNPDMSHIKEAEKFVGQVAAMMGRGASPLSTESGEGGEATDQVVQFLRNARVSVGFFRPQEQKVWTVVFWIFAIGAGITGLLSFVRSSSSF